MAELEGGVGALSVSSGQTALYYASLNLTEMGRNIVSVPQLYGTTYTLFAHILPKLGVNVRFAKSDRAADIEALIDENTRAVFCETVGNPAGNVCDLEALAAVAHRHDMPLMVDNTVPTPMLLRPVEYGADIIVHSLTKFMGGHGTTLGGIVVDCGNFSWTKHAARYPMFTRAGRVLPRVGLHRALRSGGIHRPLPQRLPAHRGCRALADERFSLAAGNRDGRAAGRSPRAKRRDKSPSSCAAIRASRR